MADAMDVLRRAGRAPGPLCRHPDQPQGPVRHRRRAHAGRIARAGRRAAGHGATPPSSPACSPPASIPVGRTNMTEFAFSGLGINPHYGTPRAPWDRASRAHPGRQFVRHRRVGRRRHGASPGLGTDTGGSCRIPAAFCGIVGYKPTARRVPIAGVLPLAPRLDRSGRWRPASPAAP